MKIHKFTFLIVSLSFVLMLSGCQSAPEQVSPSSTGPSAPPSMKGPSSPPPLKPAFENDNLDNPDAMSEEDEVVYTLPQN